ncbi:hypothetical protein J6590_068877 [Homalodisca vitripennis]|nr:hypothetical protein J6590_068877 [Homalodisca vitripennis]
MCRRGMFPLTPSKGATEARTDRLGHFRPILSRHQITYQIVQRDLTTKKNRSEMLLAISAGIGSAPPRTSSMEEKHCSR